MAAQLCYQSTIHAVLFSMLTHPWQSIYLVVNEKAIHQAVGNMLAIQHKDLTAQESSKSGNAATKRLAWQQLIMAMHVLSGHKPDKHTW